LRIKKHLFGKSQPITTPVEHGKGGTTHLPLLDRVAPWPKSSKKTKKDFSVMLTRGEGKKE